MYSRDTGCLGLTFRSGLQCQEFTTSSFNGSISLERQHGKLVGLGFGAITATPAKKGIHRTGSLVSLNSLVA